MLSFLLFLVVVSSTLLTKVWVLLMSDTEEITHDNPTILNAPSIAEVVSLLSGCGIVEPNDDNTLYFMDNRGQILL